MTQALAQIIEEAGRLSALDRAKLAEKLVETLEFSEDAPNRRAWAEEALRRRGEARAGKVKTIHGDQVLAEARRIISG